MVKPSFYKSLLIWSVEAWVTLRAWRQYDALAPEMVKYIKLPSGWESQTGTHVSSRRVRFDVLVYTIKDGKMAIGFRQLDEAEGTVASYCGPALMAI
jgi:hypothetical protein